jgi:hypothetical protein
MSRQVNRSLDDKTFDHIDHALGRPVDPMAETYRNYFAIMGKNPLADEFDSSPHWVRGRVMGDTTAFHVTNEGRKALADHLRTIGDRHRTFEVVFNGNASTVIAKSHSKARYSYYLDVSDCFPDLTFKEFCKATQVRLA